MNLCNCLESYFPCLNPAGLPAGTEKRFGPGFEEVDMPAAKKLEAPPPGGLVEIELLESWAQLAFPGTKTLNRIQSAVFETAYGSAENMLVCAPTGETFSGARE